MVHVALFGLLEILLVMFAAIMIVGVVVSFGIEGMTGHRSRCPACGTETLLPLDAGHQPGRLRVYRCERCGEGFREQLDGTFARMSSDG